MRRGAWAAVLGLVLALAACTATPPRADLAPVRPVPAGAAVLPAGVVDPATADTSCDPTASPAPTIPATAPGVVPPGSTMARIAERGVLVVGVDQNTFPFGYRDPATGTLSGFDIAVAREMARAILGAPDRIRFITESSSQRVPNLQRGAVDLVVQTMTVSCARRAQIQFSSVYFEARQRILVPRTSRAQSLADLGGQRVCTISGSTSVAAIQTTPSRPIAVTVPEKSDCLVLLQQGQVDAISTDDTILAGFQAEDPRTEIRGPAVTNEPYGIGVAKQNEDLVRYVNAVLARMRADGTWAAIFAATFPAGTPVPTPPAAQYRP